MFIQSSVGNIIKTHPATDKTQLPVCNHRNQHPSSLGTDQAINALGSHIGICM